MVFFRAFVMLACLIVVPLAAIFGSAFPEVVKSLVDRCVGGDSSKSDAGSGGGISSFFDRGSPSPNSVSGAPSAASTAVEMAPRWQGGPEAPPAAGPTWGSGGVPSPVALAPPGASPLGGISAPGNTASLVGAVDPSGGQSPNNQVRQAAATDAPLGRSIARPEQAPNAFATQGAPAARLFPPADAPPAQLYPPADSPNARVLPAAQALPGAQPERFVTLEHKLREYGATYYLLETWGNDGELYRFHCKMAVGNNPNFTQRFEATDRDALRAMSRVLEQVEAWRAGRTQ